MASVFVALRRVTRSATDQARLAQSLMAAFVGFVVGGCFLSLAYSDMLYTLAALAVGLEKVSRARTTTLLPAAGAARRGRRDLRWRAA
jgi:hypothetical protein